MTQFDPATSFHYFEIWSPRYHDGTVLLAKRKVGTHNKVVFTKAPSMGTDPYYVSGAVVKKCKKMFNNKLECYIVPLDKLSPLELNDNSVLELW